MATTVYTDSMRARAATLLETAKTWNWGRRKSDGIQFVLFSSSRPGHAYYTSQIACSCTGYLHRGACSHQLAVSLHVERVQEEAARPKRPTYEDLWQGDGSECTDAF